MKVTKHYFLFLMLTLGIGLSTASCSSSDDNSGNGDNDPPPGKKELILSASETSIILNTAVQFTAKFGGETVNDFQLIVQGQELENGTKSYTFTEVGEFKVQAKKSTGELSNTVNISVFKDNDEIENATKFKHRVLVEDFTGAWCQYCPRVAYKIEQLETNRPEDIIAIAIHNSQSSNVNNGGHDPFDFFKSERNAFEREVGVGGYPFGMINRSDDFEDNYDQFASYIKESSSIGIKIESEVFQNDGTIKIGIKFGEQYASGVKYAVFMLEDHLLFRQSNSTNYYSHLPRNGNFSLDFEHNNTLVGMFNGFRGTEISSSVAKAGSEFSNNDIYMRHNAQKLENTKIVVIVTDMQGKVLNAASAKTNTKMDYQVVR